MNISWGNYLFGFNGRINRAKWWLAVLILVGVQVVLSGFGMIVQSESVTNILSFAYFIFSLWVSLAVGAKRLHDLDRTAAWLAVFFGGQVVIFLIGLIFAGASLFGAIVSGETPDISQLARLGGLAMILIALAVGLWLWGLIWFGCLRGTVGPNQYGPDPLQPTV